MLPMQARLRHVYDRIVRSGEIRTVALFVLLAGVLFFGEGSAIFYSSERASFSNLEHPVLSFDLHLETSDAQIHTFIEALLALPQVRDVSHQTPAAAFDAERTLHPESIAFFQEASIENPFVDRMSIELHSFSDIAPFIIFLKIRRINHIVRAYY